MSDNYLEMLLKELVKNGVSLRKPPFNPDKFTVDELEIEAVQLEPFNFLDFSEHDKVFEDKIAEQKNEISMLKSLIDNYRDAESKLFDENKDLKQRIAELESKETEKPTKINLNDQIKVKLTPLGAEIYYHQYDELNKWIKERGGKQLEPRMPEIDKDGYTKFTLWNFMELYGEHIGMCKPSVISPLYIELCQDEWKMRYNEEPIEKGKE